MTHKIVPPVVSGIVVVLLLVGAFVVPAYWVVEGAGPYAWLVHRLHGPHGAIVFIAFLLSLLLCLLPVLAAVLVLRIFTRDRATIAEDVATWQRMSAQDVNEAVDKIFMSPRAMRWIGIGLIGVGALFAGLALFLYLGEKTVSLRFGVFGAVMIAVGVVTAFTGRLPRRRR